MTGKVDFSYTVMNHPRWQFVTFMEDHKLFQFNPACIIFLQIDVREFGRVCERRKLRVNVGKSKVMRCSRYGNGGRMHVTLNGEPLVVDCFKYLVSQVAADLGCERDVVHRMNTGYRAWGAPKSVLSNRGLGIKAPSI